ncbi:ankyrin repeat domain-containing protein [Candidatus Dependentiae bacterium]|nr:ankyrin repeat domain-containing protein [Candidatus Dependentiae bacterium]
MFLNILFFILTLVIYNSHAMETLFYEDQNIYDEDIGSPSYSLRKQFVLPSNISDESSALIFLIKTKQKLEESTKFLRDVVQASFLKKECDQIIINIMIEKFQWSELMVDAFNNNVQKIDSKLTSGEVNFEQFNLEFLPGKINPLMVATANDSVEIVERLLREHAKHLLNMFTAMQKINNYFVFSPSFNSDDFQKPLSAINESISYLEDKNIYRKMLLKYLTQKNHYGYSAKELAAILNSAKVMKLFLDLDDRNQDITNLFYLALKNDSVDVIKVIHEKYNLKNYITVNINNIEMSELHFTAYFGARRTLNYLLENYSDVNCLTKDFETPLHFAAVKNQVETAEILIKHGANIYAKSVSGKTPLMMCAMTNSLQVAQLLITYNANVDEQDCQKWTALMLAAKSGHREIFNLLLSVSESTFQNNQGQTYLDIVMQYHPDLLTTF